MDIVSNLDTKGNKITGLPTPTAPTDAANKSYVDEQLSEWKIDTQNVVTSGQTTTSATFADLAGCALTTKNLSQNVRYRIVFNASFTNNVILVSNFVEIRIVVDGTPLTGLMQQTLTPNNTQHHSLTFLLNATITGAKVIKIQWRTSGGTTTCRFSNLEIFGVPVSRIAT